MRRMTTTMRLGTIGAVLVLVLAACGGSVSDTTTTTVVGGADDTTTTAAPDETTTTAVEVTTTTAPNGSGGGDDCLIGTWSLDAGVFFQAIMDSMTAEELAGGSFEHVSGEYQAVVGADGSFIDRRIDWHFKVSSEMGEIEIIVNHERTGEWRTEDGLMLVTLPGDVPADQEILIDGEPFEFPGGALPFSPPAVDWIPAAYDCSGDTLAITADGITTFWSRA